MKHLLLLVFGASLCPTALVADDEPAKTSIRTVDSKGLRIQDEITKTDPRRRFSVAFQGKGFVLSLQAKVYNVKLLAGKRYVITMDAVKPGLDSYLVVQDEKGKTIGFDDDSGGNLNARLQLDVTATGTYKVCAASLSGLGAFAVQISESLTPKINIVRQGFPAAQSDPTDLTRSDTAWEVEWTITNPDNNPGKGTQPSSILAIRSAKFMFKDAAGKVRWFTVLKNLEVGEILVPYDRFEPVFMDVAGHAFHIIKAKKEFLGPNCVLPGEILDSADPRMKNKVMKEVHDEGLRWLDQHDRARRGEKMMLWAIFNGGNYRYLIEYGFRDDGCISCRVGATAHNFFDRQKDQRDVHLHVACWRFDPELAEIGQTTVGGASANRVLLVRRMPRSPSPSGRFRVDVTPFNCNEAGLASEGFADWKPEEFTTLRIESMLRRNGSKNPHFTAYDLVPVRLGVVRNYPWKFEFVNHEFWVTRRHMAHQKFHDAPLYATQGRPIEKTPITVWHNAAALHVPRGEDYGPEGASRDNGAAITTWAEFMLKPVNLFDSTPLYQMQGRKK